MRPAPPEKWLAESFGCLHPSRSPHLAAALDRAAHLARSKGKALLVTEAGMREQLWSMLTSIDPALPAKAQQVEDESVRKLWWPYSPQPIYHQVGLLVGAILFPRICVAVNDHTGAVRMEPDVGDEESLVFHPECHVPRPGHTVPRRVDTRISLQTSAGVLCELYDECDPSSTHSGERGVEHRARRQELAGLGIVPESTGSAALTNLTERWELLYSKLRSRHPNSGLSTPGASAARRE